MPFTRLRYHVVTATRRRYPLITEQIEPILYRVLVKKTADAGGQLLAVGGVQDHVHLVVALPPTIPVSDLMRVVKSGSCVAVRDVFGKASFEWQEGYAAFTADPSDLDRLMEYVTNQKERHASRRLWPAYEYCPA
jgi:REP element-mobilizing transposase RayT